MVTVNIDPIIFSFGHFMLRWYGVIVASALGTGIWVASREAKRKGISDKVFGDAILWGIVGGLVGARLFHALDYWPHEYAANPIRALYFWEGGLAIWGAVIGGLVAIALFAWRRNVRFSLLLADTVTPGPCAWPGYGWVACMITGDAVGRATTGLHLGWPTPSQP